MLVVELETSMTSTKFLRLEKEQALSEENIKRTMDFHVNTMKLKSEVIASHSSLLCYARNKRIRPCYSIIQVLASL
ncbi:hypothetical protein LguiA_028162 [Lonicera macranthoides]